jgi:hypothetical protein
LKKNKVCWASTIHKNTIFSSLPLRIFLLEFPTIFSDTELFWTREKIAEFCSSLHLMIKSWFDKLYRHSI